MKKELYWVALNILWVGVLWVPYILNAMVKRGIVKTMGYDENLPPLSPWADRAKKAHYNSVENLVLFAPAALLFFMLGGSDGVILIYLRVYFFARVVHYLSYTLKVSYLRTLSFVTGWICTIFIIFKAMSLACDKLS